MNDDQVEYLQLLLTKVKVEVYYCYEGQLSLVTLFQAEYTEANNPLDTTPEPVVWLKTPTPVCIALWASDIKDFRVFPDIALWPAD